MKVVIGIDEVGRGPIAGPVAVCAFALSHNLKRNQKKLPLRDSKKLTRAQREAWFTEIQIWKKEGKCDFAVTMISAEVIDRIGIVPAIRLALDTSLKKVAKKNKKHAVLLDGGLRAPAEFKNQKTIIKGDEKYPAISLASIAAKVTRDRHMFRQAKKFPHYAFDEHVGYGTKKHYEAINKHGITPLHRLSFLKKMNPQASRNL